MGTDWRQVVWIALAIVGFLGALVACGVAWWFRTAPCETAICTSSSLGETQLIVALVGLLPAAGFLYATSRDRTRLTIATLAAALAIYAAWALLVFG